MPLFQAIGAHNPFTFCTRRFQPLKLPNTPPYVRLTGQQGCVVPSQGCVCPVRSLHDGCFVIQILSWQELASPCRWRGGHAKLHHLRIWPLHAAG